MRLRGDGTGAPLPLDLLVLEVAAHSSRADGHTLRPEHEYGTLDTKFRPRYYFNMDCIKLF